MSYDLKSAIVDAINEAIDLSSDKIVRIDIKSNWPIADALIHVKESFPNLTI